VKRLLESGHSLQEIRLALDQAARVLKTDHFARQTFFVDEKSIYLKLRESGGAMLDLLPGGQWVMRQVIEDLGSQIDFSETDGLARRWHPMGRDFPVVLDPRVAFGSPSLDGTGIKTANVFNLYLAERRDASAVGDWFSLTESEVLRAVEFEERLAA